LHPSAKGLVARAILQTSDGRKRYRERVLELLANVVRLPDLTNRVSAAAARVRPALERAPQGGESNYDRRVSAFTRRIAQRLRALEDEAFLSQAVSFDQAGICQLQHWRPKIDIGSPILERVADGQSGALLHISTKQASAASWRTRVVLDAGIYRFESKVRLEGVTLSPEDAKAGAGLRISRRPFTRKLSGTLEPTVVTYDFEVEEDQNEVELVCELRATEGQIWFELASLRLVRKQ
jgi:hypothetical protein